jgi:PIN domain nuclease of toxin-antitoxin system
VAAWARQLFDEDRVGRADLTPQAAVAAATLPPDFPGDPADRFLYATARELAVPFLTKDARLQQYARTAGDVRTIW